MKRSFSTVQGCLVALVLAAIVFAVPAGAQEKPRVETYGGYSILKLNLPSKIEGQDTGIIQSAIGNVLGWNGGVTTNITQNFGITADVSGYYRKFEGEFDFRDAVHASASIHSFLFGPRFSGSGDTVRPFGHALFGFGRLGASVGGDSVDVSVHNTGFAMAFGGGVDVKVGEKMAIRAIQFDYFPTRQRNEDVNQNKSLTFNNFRFGSGLVFYLGR